MKDLMKEKREIVDKHVGNLQKNCFQILNLKQKAVKDRKGGIDFAAEVFSRVKGAFKFNNDELLNMDGAQRLEYAKQWSDDLRYVTETLKSDEGYQSLLNDMDRQIKSCEDELKQLNEELLKCEDDDKRQRLLEKQQEGWTKRV